MSGNGWPSRPITIAHMRTDLIPARLQRTEETIDSAGPASMSLARPGGNATGFMSYEYSLSGKWLELLKQIAPHHIAHITRYHRRGDRMMCALYACVASGGRSHPESCRFLR